jgi:Phospholipase_D-nuclease N-terminal
VEWTLTFFLEVGLALVVAVLWIGCIIDVVTRPDLRLMHKALWTLGILVLPIIGSVVYLITRPRNITARKEEADEIWGEAADSFPTTWNDAADTITKPYQQR